MNMVAGLTLRREVVHLDDKKFVGCTFVECRLEYAGGPVVFEHTRLSKCRYVFFGPARATVHFLQEVGLLPYVPSEWGEVDSTTSPMN